MTTALARHGAMPKKTDDSVSPYLRRRLREFEEVAPKPAKQPDRVSAEPDDACPAKRPLKPDEAT